MAAAENVSRRNANDLRHLLKRQQQQQQQQPMSARQVTKAEHVKNSASVTKAKMYLAVTATHQLMKTWNKFSKLRES